MRYSSDHKAETRERVLKEAANEIRAKGPDNVAVSGIMARAGLTHGGFYAHFPSKDALVKEAIGTMFADARARSDKIDADGDPRDVLRAYVDFYLSPAHRDRREESDRRHRGRRPPPQSLHRQPFWAARAGEVREGGCERTIFVFQPRCSTAGSSLGCPP